jgi:hypothetical protein
MHHYVLMFVLVNGWSGVCLADPYFIQYQLGANQGLYAIGLGHAGETFEPSLSFGYLPPIHGGSEVTQGNLKANWKIVDNTLPNIQWLAGFSLLINVSKETFFEVPKKYPNKYYPPNAYFFSIQTSIRHHGFYIEASILDYYLEVAARNRNSVEYISELVSIGFGYVQPIDFQWSDISNGLRSWFQ